MRSRQTRRYTENMKFVLVHGGWHGGWSWVRVARLLRARGHEVWTPTLTGLGERAHLLSADLTLETGIQDVAGVLEAEELSDVVLVGHSLGGVSAAGAADRMPERIRSLILLDGVVMQSGERMVDTFTAPQTAAYEAVQATGALGVPPPPAALFHIPDGPDAEWVNRRLTPQPSSVVESPLRLLRPVGEGLRCVYIACTAPLHPFVSATHDWVRQQANWHWRELAAGHDAMITEPEAVAGLLEELGAS